VVRRVKADVASKRGFNPKTRHRSFPRATKPRTATKKYPTRKATYVGVIHAGPPTIRLANRAHLTMTTAQPRAA
jgi:hypothetical protein